MKTFLSFLFVVFSFVSISSAQDGFVDQSFNSADLMHPNREGLIGSVSAMSVGFEDKIYLAGNILRYNGFEVNSLIRLMSDGTLDVSFNAGAGTNGAIKSILELGDGSLLIGGEFTEYNGSACAGLIRLTNTGELDTSFNLNGPNGPVSAIALLSDGRIAVGGAFTEFDGVPRRFLAVLNGEGFLDSDFALNCTIQGSVNSLVADNNSIYFNSWGGCGEGIWATKVLRCDYNGILDVSFRSAQGSGAQGGINVIDMVSNGSLIVGGAFDSFGGVEAGNLARLNSDGSIDVDFTTSTIFNDDVGSLVITSNDDILVAGLFSELNESTVSRLLRLDASGVIDHTFTPSPGSGNINVIKLKSDGNIIVGGSFAQFDGCYNGMVCLDSNGMVNVDFNQGSGVGGTLVADVHTIEDGRIYLAGPFCTVNGEYRKGVARLNVDGTLDSSFNPGYGAQDGVVLSVVPLTNGNILVLGSFERFNNYPRSNVVMLDASGNVVEEFLFPIEVEVGNYWIAGVESSTNSVIICGGTDGFNGNSGGFIAEVSHGGELLNLTFPFANESSIIRRILKDGDGGYLLGGWFTSYNGVPRHSCVKITSSGVLVDGFVPDLPEETGVNDVIRLSDGKVALACYDLPSYSNHRIVLVDANGNLDQDFQPLGEFNNAINSLTTDFDGRIIACGEFTQIGDIARAGVVRMLLNGEVDSSFDPGDGTAEGVFSMSFSLDGLVIGGYFSSFNGFTTRRVARLLNSSVTGIGEPQIGEIRVNSSSNLISWDCRSCAENSIVEIVDTFGRVVSSLDQHSSSLNCALNISGLANGIYLLRTVCSKRVSWGRFVVEH